MNFHRTVEMPMTTQRDPHIVGAGFRWFLLYAFGLLLVMSALWCAKHADAAVSAEWRVNLVKGTTTVSPASVGATQEAAWAACQARIPKSATTTATYKCQTPVYVAVISADPAPPPPPVNVAPTISGVPAAAVVAGQAYAFTPVAADADGDTLAFTIVNKPSWASFSATTGALTGTPAAANVGITSSIRITVSDGKGGSAATPVFSITVTAATTPPPALTAPTNFKGTVAPNVANPDRYDITLTWNAVAGATSYEIDRCTGAGCSESSFAVIGTSTTTQYINNNLPAGLSFSYGIRARNAQGNGPWVPKPLTIVTPTVTPPPPPPPPPPPAGSAKIAWAHDGKYTDDTPATLAGFRILYSTVGVAGPSLSQTIQVPGAAIRSYTVTGLTAGPWAFAVEAYDTQGRTSQPSAIAQKVVP